MKNITLKGVRQNNLKNVDIEIPIGSITTVCGPSGSGKSSLAFETLYAEGQRRYIESLSNYTKQFLNKAPKPDVDVVENIPPSLSIEQKNGVKSSRSTVGTHTEITDYLRLLFEKLGSAYCPDHKIALTKDNVASATEKIIKNFDGDRGYVLCMVSEKKRLLKNKELLKFIKTEGFARILVPKTVRKTKKKATKKKVSKSKAKSSSDQVEYFSQKIGDIIELSDPALIKKGLPKKDFYIVVDRLAFSEKSKSRLMDSVSQAYSYFLKLNTECPFAKMEVITTEGKTLKLSEENSCSVCEYSFPEINSRLFSFNSPVGACSACNGFGNILEIDEGKIIPNDKLCIAEGTIKPFAMPSAKREQRKLLEFCKSNKIDIYKPWNKLVQKQKEKIWNGNSKFKGINGFFAHLEKKKYKMHVRVFLARHKSPFKCSECNGSRLKKQSLEVLIGEHNIADYSSMTVKNLKVIIDDLKLSPEQAETCKEVLRQLRSRLGFLADVGVSYLNLDRPTKTLSGGEFQRLSLSNQLGMGLSQTLYVLDEPTIGLHPRDNDRLIKVIKGLNELGNTLVIVEHDLDIIKHSSHVVELGPGSGHLGGEITYAGTTEDFYEAEDSITAFYLNPSKSKVPLRDPRPVNIKDYKYKIELSGCSGNNLKNVNLQVPLNRLVTVTGVSGSGKSSLISDTLYPAVARELNVEHKQCMPYKKLTGLGSINNVLFVDQTSIGKTARSMPATYLKIFDPIRKIMASSSEAKLRGYTPGTFSLNVDGGRCPVCKGLGFEIIDMMFMDDVHLECDSCNGRKYRDEILDIKYQHKNIYEILNMTVLEAMDFFVAYPNIRRPLSTLKEIGLDYITLGQTSKTLSGGESQRLKLAKEFNSAHQGTTLYILDEPTTGLHFREVHLLLKALNRLVDAGGSVLLIEHNLEVIQNSDYLIDVGPEAGLEGGQIIAQGSPEKLMKSKKSLTGQYLKEYIDYLGPKK